MKKIELIYLLLLFLVIHTPIARASIEVSNQKPEVGERLTLTFPVPVDTLTVTYRPNSSVSKTEVVAINPPATSVEWASKEAGLVALAYMDKTQEDPQRVSKNMSVRFQGVSGSGIVVMLFAGVVLFGGAATAFRTLFREQDEGRPNVFDPEEMPDT